jgi:hypothetical protein
MTRTLARSTLALALVAALAACSVEDAAGVATSAISPRIRVASFPDGRVEVSVALRYGFASVLVLPDGDGLTVRREGGAAVAMVAGEDALGAAAYLATVDGVGPGDALIVALTRANEEGAPATRLTVPADFTLTSPTDGAAFESGAAVPLSWPPEAGAGVVDARLVARSCSGGDDDTFAFVAFINGLPATFDLSAGAGSLANRTLIGDAASCAFDLRVGRGGGAVELDPAFAGLAPGSAVVRLAEVVRIDVVAAP